MILVFLLISFFIGYLLILLFKLLFKKQKSKKVASNPDNRIEKNQENEVRFEKIDSIRGRSFLFMDRLYNMKTSETEKQEHLTDLKVIFEHGKDLLKREMIKSGFKAGSKIIDVKKFEGLDENGRTVITVLIQHENGGEIRSLQVGLNLDKMTSWTHEFSNQYHSNGKEKYWYLENKKAGLMKI